MIRYFISYHHRAGFGNCWLDLPRSITGNADTTTLQDMISKQRGAEDVVILFVFQPAAPARTEEI